MNLRKVLLLAAVVLGLGGSLVGQAPAATLEVGPGKTYTTIQAAIGAANGGTLVYSNQSHNIPGDEIVVYAGTYAGFTVSGNDMDLLTIRTYKNPAECSSVGERATVTGVITLTTGAEANLIEGFYVANPRSLDTLQSSNGSRMNTWKNMVVYGSANGALFSYSPGGADKFEHCTIYDNGYVTSGSNLADINNSIVAFNDDGYRGTTSGDYNCLFDNPNPDPGYGSNPPGANDINSDPVFCSTNPSNAFFLWLTPSSPCNDAAGDGNNMGALPTYDSSSVILTSSEPEHLGCWAGYENNELKMVFLAGINPGDLPAIPLTIMETGTTTDLAGSFTYRLDTTNVTNDTLIARETGTVLTDKTSYTIQSTGTWCLPILIELSTLCGDIDGDGNILMSDYCLLADACGSSGPDLGPVDLNGDGIVDAADLFGLQVNWLLRAFVTKDLLSDWNDNAPFPYIHEGTRSWPITTGYIPTGTTVTLKARIGATVLDEGTTLNFSGLTISLGHNGKLKIVSAPGSPTMSFELDVTLDFENGLQDSQTGLEVRPAPPDRPISYVADTSDDFYYIFPNAWEGSTWKIEKGGFDQYFRRLQAQGVTREIMWLRTFPFIADPCNYEPQDWDRHKEQSMAIINSGLCSSGTWSWGRRMLSPSFQADFGEKLSQSAIDHGIPLAISYRPFEPALTKYYEIPAFDSDGTYLWGFLPFASPAVNYHPEDVCYSHYRTMLKDMGHPEMGRIGTIEITNMQNTTTFLNRWNTSGDNLKIVAANFPPIQDYCYVLQRQTDGSFEMVQYTHIKPAVQSQLFEVTGFDVVLDGTSILITNLDIPDQFRYIMLSNPSQAADAPNFHKNVPIKLWSQAGYEIGRKTWYWALNSTIDPDQTTYIAGITADGGFNTEFYTTENSVALLKGQPTRRYLVDETLVIDHGMPHSVELIDFNQQAARDFVVAELATILAYPAFDEIFINTRTHTDLAYSMGDTLDLTSASGLGLASSGAYASAGYLYYQYMHLGAHLAYTPQSSATNSRMLACVADPDNKLERITQWIQDEFSYYNPCQSPTTNFDWRYTRVTESANGIRELMIDLEDAFPGLRTRVVLPERQAANEAVKAGLDLMGYGSDYMRYIWSTNNFTYTTCEGMALLDLTGLAAEPVFSGIRHAPDQNPLELYIDECIINMADNHGSSYSGPRSIFYEAGSTINSQDSRRNEIICYLLSETADINEVILYEAASWTYSLNINDPYVYGYYFLDSCP